VSIKSEICETKCKNEGKMGFYRKESGNAWEKRRGRGKMGNGTVFQKKVPEWGVKTGKKFRAGK
jgi:hypothetical protein